MKSFTFLTLAVVLLPFWSAVFADTPASEQEQLLRRVEPVDVAQELEELTDALEWFKEDLESSLGLEYFGPYLQPQPAALLIPETRHSYEAKRDGYWQFRKENTHSALTANICEKSSGVQRSCANYDERSCREIFEKDECYMALIQQEGKRTLLRCLQLSEKKQPLCLRKIVLQEDGPEICNIIAAESEKTRAGCLTYFAGQKSFEENKADLKACRGIEGNSKRYTCYKTTLLSYYQRRSDLTAAQITIPPTQQKYAKEVKDCGAFESLFNRQHCYHSIPYDFYAKAGYVECSYQELHPCKRAKNGGLLYSMLAGDKRGDKTARTYAYAVMVNKAHNPGNPNYKLFADDLTRFLHGLSRNERDIELFCRAAMPVFSYDEWIMAEAHKNTLEHLRIRDVFCTDYPYLRNRNWYWKSLDETQ